MKNSENILHISHRPIWKKSFESYIKKNYPDLYEKYFTIKYNPKKLNWNKLNWIAILDEYIPEDMIKVINNNEWDNRHEVYLTKEQVKDLEQLWSINVPINQKIYWDFIT